MPWYCTRVLIQIIRTIFDNDSVMLKHHSPIVGKGICLVQIAMLHNRCELWCPLYCVFCLFRDLEIILRAAQTHHYNIY